jgi:hypothetical protein
MNVSIHLRTKAGLKKITALPAVENVSAVSNHLENQPITLDLFRMQIWRRWQS